MMWYIYTMEYYSATKMKECHWQQWMSLEMSILSEVNKSKQILYSITISKNDINELIYKTERDSQT